MLASDTKTITHCHSAARWGRPPAKTRTIIAKAAALVPTDMNAVTGIGAPWYTSGVHIWNGAAETLKAKPTPISTMPRIKSGLLDAELPRTVAILGISVVPDAPYTSAIPYRTNALANPPTRRYFAPASCDRLSSRADAHET